ncbi:MAG: DUF3311 domain-containing protein [Bryobacteraceae bacterium]|nr:DUF3311 domain-containing protein [Bryobacteraceae bacterium]MDW8377833.1 DUF3311 domain-containing protein [Bryobacterales bacterium]
MKRAAVVALVVIYWALHQDVWFWRTAHPFAFGFLPVGLTYHALYTVGASLLMFLLVKVAWPSDLEQEVDRSSD